MSDGSNESDTPIPEPYGCSDGGCVMHDKPRSGMRTNGGCMCKRELTRIQSGREAVQRISSLERELNQWQSVAGKLAESLADHRGVLKARDRWNTEDAKALAEFQKLKEGSE